MIYSDEILIQKTTMDALKDPLNFKSMALCNLEKKLNKIGKLRWMTL